MAIFLAILFIYLLHSGLNKLRKRTPVFPLKGPYLGAILESVLLGYSAVTGTTMRLLYCVEIQHVHRWYYNAEITCLEPVDNTIYRPFKQIYYYYYHYHYHYHYYYYYYY